MTVRTGVVTHPSVTSSASRSRQCRTTPSDAPLGRLRLARTVTCGSVDASRTFQPQCSAAVVCEAAPLSR